jgi:hypothetical protein
MDPITRTMLLAGGLGMAGGVVSGAVIGLFFHREDWMGGYQSFRRRLIRLGHISFFGLGFLNLAFALTHHAAPAVMGSSPWIQPTVASAGLLVGAVTMPTCCFLTAWRKEPFRHLFFIPVTGVAVGITVTLLQLGSLP